MATCLGYRYGTGCMHRSRSTQKRVNWVEWQLCERCARKLHPGYYAKIRNHGVRQTDQRKIEVKVMDEKT